MSGKTPSKKNVSRKRLKKEGVDITPQDQSSCPFSARSASLQLLPIEDVTADLIEMNARKTMAIYILLDEYLSKIENGSRLDRDENECFDILRRNGSEFTDWLVNVVGADRCNDLVSRSPRYSEIEKLFYDLGIMATSYQTRILKCAKKRLQK